MIIFTFLDIPVVQCCFGRCCVQWLNSAAKTTVEQCSLNTFALTGGPEIPGGPLGPSKPRGPYTHTHTHTHTHKDALVKKHTQDKSLGKIDNKEKELSWKHSLVHLGDPWVRLLRRLPGNQTHKQQVNGGKMLIIKRHRVTHGAAGVRFFSHNTSYPLSVLSLRSCGAQGSCVTLRRWTIWGVRDQKTLHRCLRTDYSSIQVLIQRQGRLSLRMWPCDAHPVSFVTGQTRKTIEATVTLRETHTHEGHTHEGLSL